MRTWDNWDLGLKEGKIRVRKPRKPQPDLWERMCSLGKAVPEALREVLRAGAIVPETLCAVLPSAKTRRGRGSWCV